MLFSQWFPLIPAYRQVPLADVRDFTPSLNAGFRYGILLLALYGVYALAYWLMRQSKMPRRPWLILGPAMLFGLPLLLTHPINATDVYRYFLSGRIVTELNANPYTTPPAAFPDDPYLPLAGEWISETTPYGPLWEWVDTAVALLTSSRLLPSLVAFKVIGLVGLIGCGWLIWRLLAHAPPARRAAYTLLWAWNPALLLTFVMDAHNDALMLFWLLLGLWIWRRGYLAAGLVVMMIAVLTKPIALLALPLFFVAGWKGLPDWRHRLRLLVFTAVGVTAVTALAFLPFGSPWALVTRLLREASTYPGFSISTLILLIKDHLSSPVTMPQLNLITRLGQAALLVLMAWLLWRTWHGRAAVRSTADAFFGYLLQAGAFRIWYAAWPFPWLLVDDTPAASTDPNGRLPFRLRLGIWFLLTTQLSVIIYGHLHAYRYDFEELPTHLIGVPFTFGLPLLLAALPDWVRWFRQKDHVK